MDRLRFCLNDRWVELTGISPTTTLLRYLRDQAQLTGTKEGCAEGDCGACSVAVVESDAHGRPAYRSVNACLVFLPMLQGKTVFTVEALKRDGVHHPAQEALAQKLGSQCGYCTPGIVMSMFEACYRQDLDAPWKLDAQMCGNLCRCTGYRPIRDATAQVAGQAPQDHFREALEKAPVPRMALSYAHREQRFYNPVELVELWELLDTHPTARFVAGGTDLALEVTKRFAEPPLLISVEGLSELARLETTAAGLFVGATVTLTRLEDLVQDSHPPLARMLRYFAARAIKNRATVGGNLCNASPIGDLPPVLISLGAIAVLRSRQGERRVKLEDFFVGYRKTALQPKEVFAGVEIPALASTARAAAYKVSKRRELDISCVSAGLRVETDGAGKVTLAVLAYGGMAATPARAKKAEASLLGKPWTLAEVEGAALALAQDFTPLSDHRGSARYRLRVAQNLLRGFFEETSIQRLPGLSHPHTATVEVR